VVVILQRLSNRREVQALEATHLDDVVLQAPLLGLQRYHVVDVLQQAGDCVSLGAVRFRDVPEHVGGGDAVSLNSESEAHAEHVESRKVATGRCFFCDRELLEDAPTLASRSNQA
jgi:hypothetical protein